ncbi:MAG: TonB-dependent receptor [Muribaculaceae bacterium]|nr:TonB-dependent receptor [Muribaculaceae bacterium]
MTLSLRHISRKGLKPWLRTWLAAGLWLTGAMTCQAANVIIKGKAVDIDHNPVEFVTVRVAGSAIGTNTDGEGRYQLTAPYPSSDTLTVVFSCIGYHELTRKLANPSTEAPILLNVTMRQKEATLKEVEVTDFKRQTTAMTTVSRDAMRRSPDATGGSVEGVIMTMGGVSSGNELSTAYSVRGGNYDENSVRINGIDLYRPQLITSGQQEGLSIINPEMTDRVEFSTGGFPAEYDDKMSSVLDITYRRPDGFDATVTAGLMGASGTLGYGNKKFAMLHGIRYKQNSALLGTLDTHGEYDPRFLDYQAALSWQPSQRLTIGLMGNVASNRYRFTPTDRTTSFGTVSDAKRLKVYFDGRENDRFDTWAGALTVNYRQSRANDFTLLASGFLTDELVAYDISGEYWLDQAGTEGGGESGSIGGENGVGRYHEHARNRLKISVLQLGLRGNTGLEHHNLTYGADIRRHKAYERSREWELHDSAGFSLPSNGSNLSTIYALTARQDVEFTKVTAFAQDAWKVNTASGFLSINAGLRMSYNSFNKEFLLSPRVMAAFVPERNSRWAFRASAGLYYQSPFYRELRMMTPMPDDSENNLFVELNRDIKSPRSLQLIVGTDYTFHSFGRPFKFSTEVYYKHLSNLIPYEIENLKVVYTGRNTGRGHAMGIDMKIFGQFVPGVDSWLTLSLMNTGEKNAETGGRSVPLPSDRRYGLSLYFSDYFPKITRLKFNLRALFNDGLPVTAPHTTRQEGYFRMPAYKRVDVGLSYALVQAPAPTMPRTGIHRWLKQAWISVDAFNLLDIANVAGYYWVTDVNNIRYAVPNYLTRRQFNVTLTLDF